MSERDGGSVFPSVSSSHGNDQYGQQPYTAIETFGGMSLRDYFAAKAMQAFIAADPSDPYDKVAEWAYEQADAMLAKREKP